MQISGIGLNCACNPQTSKADIDRIVEHLTTTNISRIRREFDFFATRRQEETAIEQYAIKKLRSHNIQILWVLAGIVPWTTKNLINPARSYEPISKQYDEFQQFVSAVVLQYQQYIDHRQIRNEQNTTRFRIEQPNPQAYVKLVQTTTTTISDLQPDATIVCGWIFYDPSQWFLPHYNKDFLKECIALGLDNFIDIYAVHPYSLSCYLWYQNPKKLIETTMSNIDDWIKNSGIGSNKRVRITEFGISSTRTRYTIHEKISIYRTLYHQLQQKDMLFFIRNVCDFWSQRHGPFNPEKTFGLLSSDYKLKPEFIELSQQLGN